MKIMTPTRAKYLLDNQVFGGDLKYSFVTSGDYSKKTTYEDGITKEEDFELKFYMNQYPHNCSISSILRDISFGIYKVDIYDGFQGYEALAREGLSSFGFLLKPEIPTSGQRFAELIRAYSNHPRSIFYAQVYEQTGDTTYTRDRVGGINIKSVFQLKEKA